MAVGGGAPDTAFAGGVEPASAILRAMAIYGARGNSSRVYLHRFLARAGETVEAGELVLDAGAGRAPYRGLFAHAGYETADFLDVAVGLGCVYAEKPHLCSSCWNRRLPRSAFHFGSRGT